MSAKESRSGLNAEVNAALLRPLQVLWVEVWERLEPRRLENSSRWKECGGVHL